MSVTKTYDSDDRGRLLSLGEACELCRVGKSTMYGLLAAKLGPPGFQRPGSNRWLFWAREVEAWRDGKLAPAEPETVPAEPQF